MTTKLVCVNLQQEALHLCRKLEVKLRSRNLAYHVALTGSALYGRPDDLQERPPNDIDIVLYPHREAIQENKSIVQLMEAAGIAVRGAGKSYGDDEDPRDEPLVVEFNLETGTKVNAWVAYLPLKS